jgi:hypothetical protein
MIAIAIISGLLSTMNMWADEFDHVRLHINDIYMILLMTGWMFVLTNIYQNISGAFNAMHDHGNHNPNNNILLWGGIIATMIIIYLTGSQSFVNDSEFIEGTIPCHSMAILMAEKIKKKTKDKNILNLANNIIKTQTQEIKYMQLLEK